VAWAKANPRLANFGTAAAGSTPHLLGIALGHFGGASLTHVAYKGSSLGLQDLLGGNIGAMSSPVGFFLPHLASGKVRVLAVSGDQRSRFVPDVPTLKEQGIPVTAREWYGILAPSATPAHILKAAESTIQRALADGSIAETMAKAGFEIQAGNAATLGQMLRADIQEWAGITRQIGFSAES
jgi:tripartite-type tricarboxylate transporter receptor subunit TctC